MRKKRQGRKLVKAYGGQHEKVIYEYSDGTRILFKNYKWYTQLANRVRPSHKEREGRIFSWDDPPEGGHPGEDFGCRCWAEAYGSPRVEKTLISPYRMTTFG